MCRSYSLPHSWGRCDFEVRSCLQLSCEGQNWQSIDGHTPDNCPLGPYVSEISVLINWTFSIVNFPSSSGNTIFPQSPTYLILIHMSIPAEFICSAATSGPHDVSGLNHKIVSVACGTVSSRAVCVIWVYKVKENSLGISNIWRNAGFKCWTVNGK